MTYKIEISAIAQKQFNKLDRASQKQILHYIDQVISKISKPRSIGKALVGDKNGLWRYRTGHFRIICEIKDKELIILVIALGHRKDIYE